jgi:hypothetical protein
MRIRLPVFLGRRPVERADPNLEAFYQRLLNAVNLDIFRNGQWQLCERSGWPDNQSHMNILAWCWIKDGERYLVVVNFSETTAQALVRLPWDELRGRTWRLTDALSGEVYERNGDEMRDSGLFVDLGAWKCHFFRVSPV